jgi:hypothetical protein
MMTKRMGGCVVAVSFLMGACGGGEEGPMQWSGTDPHFVAEGSLEGNALSLSKTGTEAADGISLVCKREYLVDDPLAPTQAELIEVKLEAIFTIDGSEQLAEIEFKQHDMGATPLDSIVEVIPRVDGVAPEATQMWFEWEWHDVATDAELLETAAVGGEFTLREWTGTPDAIGIIPATEGTFGGVVRAQWSTTDEVELSFTAPCVKNKLTAIGEAKRTVGGQ